MARDNVARFHGPAPQWTIKIRDAYEGFDETDIDRMVVDLSEPWRVVPACGARAPPGRRLRGLHPDGAPTEAARRRAPRRTVRRRRDARVAAARLARQGPQRATRAPHGGAQRLPDLRAPPRRSRRAPIRDVMRNTLARADFVDIVSARWCTVRRRRERQREVDPMTKEDLRRKVWQLLEHNAVQRFPGAHGRIPNFVGAERAAARSDGARRLEEGARDQDEPRRPAARGPASGARRRQGRLPGRPLACAPRSASSRSTRSGSAGGRLWRRASSAPPSTGAP